jgi:hypothetical protein
MQHSTEAKAASAKINLHDSFLLILGRRAKKFGLHCKQEKSITAKTCVCLKESGIKPD